MYVSRFWSGKAIARNLKDPAFRKYNPLNKSMKAHLQYVDLFGGWHSRLSLATFRKWCSSSGGPMLLRLALGQLAFSILLPQCILAQGTLQTSQSGGAIVPSQIQPTVVERGANHQVVKS